MSGGKEKERAECEREWERDGGRGSLAALFHLARQTKGTSCAVATFLISALKSALTMRKRKAVSMQLYACV